MKNVLQEASITKLFLQSLGIVPEDEDFGEVVKKIERLTEEVLHELRIRFKKSKKENNRGVYFFYKITVGGVHFTIQNWIAKEDRTLNSMLFDGEMTSVHGTLAAEETKRYYVIRHNMESNLKKLIQSME